MADFDPPVLPTPTPEGFTAGTVYASPPMIVFFGDEFQIVVQLVLALGAIYG